MIVMSLSASHTMVLLDLTRVMLSQESSVAIENTGEFSTALSSSSSTTYHYLDATRTERRAQATTPAKIAGLNRPILKCARDPFLS